MMKRKEMKIIRKEGKREIERNRKKEEEEKICGEIIKL